MENNYILNLNYYVVKILNKITKWKHLGSYIWNN